MITTYLLDTSTLPDPLECEKGMSALPAERIEKIKRLTNAAARRQSFGAGLLLDGCLRRTIFYNAFGKPCAAGVPFSLSHTGHFVIVSIDILEAHVNFSDTLPVSVYENVTEAPADFASLYIGCDIEKVRLYRPQLARRFFTEAEYESLAAIRDKQQQAELFCRYWTRKESVIKLVGIGLALPLNLFDVRDDGRAVPDCDKIMRWQETVKEKPQSEYRHAARILLELPLYFKEYRHDGHCITVCATKNRFAPNPVTIHNSESLIV